MKISRKRKHSHNNSTFVIQLFECAMVAMFFNLSFAFAGKLIYNNIFPFGWIDGMLLYLMMSAIAIIVLGANKYFSFLTRPFAEMAAKIIGMVFLMNFIFIALLYFSRSIRLSPYYFVVADTFQIFILVLIKRITGLFKTAILQNRVSLIIGKDQKKNELIRELRKQGIKKLAFVSFDHEKLKDYVDKADNIYLTSSLSKRVKDRIINYCILKDKRVFVIPETYEIAMRKSEMTQIGDIPLFAIESFRLTEAQNIIKRFMDIMLSMIGILLTLPIMLFAVIRIKLEDRGPVFYRQIRSGLNGKEFGVIKFRSMVVDAEKHTGAVFASENDPRITKVGNLMRATRIDEIPQFFNVLMGSMSIIGPRPERPQFVEAFSRELPEYSSRLAVKPGITGLAQVMGNYTTSAENKAKFDLVYIRDYSLLLDIKILFKTVQVVFSKSQATGFSASEKETVYDLDAEITRDGAGLNETRSLYRYQLFGKAVLVLFCSTIIIFGCMILRYSALTTTMMEAAAMPVLSETTSMTDPIGQRPTTDDFVGEITSTAVSLTDVAVTISAKANEAQEGNSNFTKPFDLPDKTENQKTTLVGPRRTETVIHRAESKGEIVLSQDEINDAMKKLSMGEKMGIVYKLISRLDATDLMILDELSEGGFTEEEKAEAKEMMYRYYNDTEVGYIKEIYWEYVE